MKIIKQGKLKRFGVLNPHCPECNSRSTWLREAVPMGGYKTHFVCLDCGCQFVPEFDDNVLENWRQRRNDPMVQGATHAPR